MLEVGTQAPDFELQDQDGTAHRLSDYRGQMVVLYFYSRDNTSGCTTEATTYSALIDEFSAKGAVVLGVSKDSVASHRRFCDRHDLKVTLLSDPEREVCAAFDVLAEKTSRGKKTISTLRTTYVIDAEGTIVHAATKVRAATNAADTLALL